MPERKARTKSKVGAKRRAPLTRDRVLDAALAIADTQGLEAVTMRSVGQALSVEAMSLYKHVANKDAILDGLVERVMREIVLPDDRLPWRAWLTERATTTRRVLLAHRFAATLIESRLAPTPARLTHHEAVLRCLRRAGFAVEAAYGAFLSLDSYVYGFVLQEVSWPFSPEERVDVVDDLAPLFADGAYPHMIEVMELVVARTEAKKKRGARAPADRAVASSAGYDADFAFGLDVLLDGLERHRAPGKTRAKR